MTFAKARAEWLERKAEESARVRGGVVPTVRPLVGGTYAGATTGAAPKAKKMGRGAAEKQHKARLVLMGCMVCLRLRGSHDPGPVELHHLRGGGWGKGDWTTLIPLCPDHHRGPSGVHELGTKGFATHYGFDQADLLADVRRAVGWTTIGETA
jgi:hypothetical protein